VSVTVCGLFPALSVIVSVPVLVPPTVGSKKTPIVQLEFTATGLLQLLNTPKSAGLAATPVIVRVAFPVFVTVTVCGSPLVPTYCAEKLTVEGDKLTTPLGGGPLPLRLIISGLSAALSVMLIVALRAPLPVGVKVT
jgi:hypothetical protein